MMGGAANPMGVQGAGGMPGTTQNPMMASMATMLNPAMQALYQVGNKFQMGLHLPEIVCLAVLPILTLTCLALLC
jgi:hypothetical protein